jgi:hypothetical protein
MTGIRRALILIGLIGTVMVGSSIPASATFADSVAVAHTVRTGSVAAPASVTINDWCSMTTSGYTDATTGLWVTTYSYWYNAQLSWPASTTTRGVTGYLVMAHLIDGQSIVMAQTDAATRSISATVDRGYLAYQPRLSIITLTSYGWTAETARSAVLAC